MADTLDIHSGVLQCLSKLESFPAPSNCPKCGGKLSEEICVDCHFSQYTALTREEAREITVAG